MRDNVITEDEILAGLHEFDLGGTCTRCSTTAVEAMSNVRKARCRAPRWFRTTVAGFAVVHGRERLMVLVAPGGFDGPWLALALASRSDTPILDDHAHEQIGEYKTEDAARRYGEAFARRWLRNAKLRSEKKCGCGPIGKKKKSYDRMSERAARRAKMPLRGRS
jgi:hypothetical protein